MENNTENTVISSQINNVSSSTVYVSFLSKKRNQRCCRGETQVCIGKSLIEKKAAGNQHGVFSQWVQELGESFCLRL